MTGLFTTILNMSITASYVALAVIVIRILLVKFKVPKVFAYLLWLPVLIRLVCPFSFSANFSILSFLQPKAPTSTGALEYVPNNLGFMQKPAVDSGISSINNAINSSLPTATPLASANPMQIAMELASMIWMIGLVILLVYSIIAYLRVLKQVQTATLVKANIFETDQITTPFVCGFIKPKIYIPTGLSESELSYILAHEQTHITRLDYLVKPVAFFVLIIHWFNPLMWLAFALMSKDMEMSCDESVVRGAVDYDIKASYANSLLALSVKSSGLLLGSPLAFGESNIKARIKNILTYQKPTIRIVAVAIVITAILIIVFTANPQNEQIAASTINSEYDLELLIANKTPYIGNNSKVVALIDALPLPVGMVRSTVELHTSKVPYGITIKLNRKNDSKVITQGALGEAFYRDAILLFSLIDNVDIINYQISDNTGKDDGVANGFSYTRQRAEQLMGQELSPYAVNADTLKKLVVRLNGLSFDVMQTAQNDQIEQYLDIISSSPSTSSNPQDYIKAHQNEYESILKMGDPALNYLLGQFEKSSNNNDLRGQISMALCKELLGDRNNVTEQSLTPQEWFSSLTPYAEVKLPDFTKPDNSNEIEQLVYAAAIKQYSRPYDGFTVVAPTIFGSYEEGNKLKVFVTVFSNRYRLYESTLSEVGGSVVPAAITFTKGADGSYILDQYLESADGSYWSKSIKAFCIMPVSKREIAGLAKKIIDDYGENKHRSDLLMKNLTEHLKANNQKAIVLQGITVS